MREERGAEPALAPSSGNREPQDPRAFAGDGADDGRHELAAYLRNERRLTAADGSDDLIQ
jgi:hypothetical protein